jgi:competence protein ComEC
MTSLTAYHRPLIPLTLALMGGIAVGAETPGFSGWALSAAAAAAVGIGCGLLRRRSSALPPLLLFAAVGYLSLQPFIQPRFSADHLTRFIDHGPRRIVGTVDERPLGFESRTRFVLRAERVESDSGRHPASGLLRVTLTGPAPAPIEQGDRIEIHARIRPLRNYNNPGGYDLRRQMGYQDIWCGAYVDPVGFTILEKRADRGVLAAVDRVRSDIAGVIDRAGLGVEGAVLKALVMGDMSGIPVEVRQAFARTGTSHILAISGLHISLVATAAFALCRWGLSRVPWCLRYAWTRKGAALLTIGPAVAYALVAGFSPSTQRALVMVVVFLTALLAERRADLKNSLSAAALAILIVHPPSLFSVSFQLSFSAVFAIVHGMEWLSACFPPPAPPIERRVRIRRWVGMFIAVSACATWGTLPICLYYFNLASVAGLLANCIVIPVMGYLSVGLGLIGSLLGALSVPAAVACHWLNGLLLAPTVAFIHWMSGLPLAWVRTVTPTILEMVLFYLLTWSGMEMLRQRRSGPAAEPPNARPVHRLRPAAAVMAVALLAATVDAGYWAFERFGRSDVRVTVLDVGQGSAVLLELPGGHTMLVDGGGVPDRTVFDVGAAVVAPYLWRQKIRTVDTLVLTHANSDHVNGLIFIAENFRIGSLWAASRATAHPGYAELLRVCDLRSVSRPAFAELARRHAYGAAEVDILFPPAGGTRHRDENNHSVVLRARIADQAVLLPGDVMHAAERELVGSTGPGLRSTVLLAPHHGSRSSSSPELVAAAAPDTVLISCREHPGGGIPHPSVLERYHAAGARVWRTDRDGALMVTADGQRLTVRSHLTAVPSD